MIIKCGRCSRKFKIDNSRIKPEGSNVRCSKCGHIFLVKRGEPVIGRDSITAEPERQSLTDIDQDIKIEKIPGGPGTDEGSSESLPDEGAGVGPDALGHPEEPQRDSSEEDMLDMEYDTPHKEAGNWEEFVNISKTGEQSEDIETYVRVVSEKEQNNFSWDNVNIEVEPGDSSTDIPEMFADDDITGTQESLDSELSEANEEPEESTASQGKSEPHGYEYKRGYSEELSLDMDSREQNLAREQNLDREQGFGRLREGTVHRGSGVYGVKSKPKRSFFGKIVYTLMIAAVFVIIIAASITILINLKLIPEKNVTQAKRFIQSVLPVTFIEEQTFDIIITQHSGNWMNTRYGPLYVVSGMIKNISEHPIHYIQIRSEFVSAGKTLYEDTTYAGNTFSENELRVSKVQDIVFKLKKKNGDIDYYDMKKLSGLNYDVRPGESIPFFAVFPYDSTVLGLKYNLEVVSYEDSLTN